MATWRIYPDLRTTYQDASVLEGKEQDCGRPIDDSNFNDVLAWAALQGAEGDLVGTGRQVLFIQGTPKALN